MAEKKLKVTEVRDPSSFPTYRLLMYTALKREEVETWAMSHGAAELHLYHQRFGATACFIGAIRAPATEEQLA